MKTQGKNKETEACTASGLLLCSRGKRFSEAFLYHGTGTPIKRQQEKKWDRK